jgi:O-antigen ligase
VTLPPALTLRRPVTRTSTLAVVALGLVLAVAGPAVAAAFDAVPLLLLAIVGLVGVAAAVRDPNLLFYLYCAAIPFNFALPPGPAGTVARIAGLVFVGGYLLRQPGALRFNAMPLTGWLFLGWALTTLLWSVQAEFGFSSWLSVAQLFGATLLVASIIAARPGTLRPALWAYSGSATLTALVGGVSFLGADTLTAGGRAAAFSGQDPALFSSIVVPAAIHFLGEVESTSNRRAVRVLAALGLIVCAGAIVLSGTRSAWIGVAVGVALWIAIRRNRTQLIALAAFAITLVFLILTVPAFANFVEDRTEYGATGSGRTDIWLVGLGILSRSPVVGVGFGNFGEAFTPYAISQAVGASASAGALFAGRDAHNTYLAMTVETGILGGLILAAFFLTPLLRRDRDTLDTVLRIALVSLFVQGMFLDLIYQKQLWLFLAFAFGLMAARRTEPLPRAAPRRGDGSEVSQAAPGSGLTPAPAAAGWR